jgi:hypothetical protein
MTKRQQDEFQSRSELHSHEVNVRKRECWNSGSETQTHAIGKLAAGWVLQERGYRTDFEVPFNHLGTTVHADVVGYAGEDQDNVVVEVETSITEETRKEKIEQYCRTNPAIRDIFIVEATHIPDAPIQEVIDWMRGEI